MEFITVSNEWLERAKQYGTQRDALNGGNNTPAYAHNGSLPYTSLTASRLAVVAEVAAHLYLGVDPESTVFVVGRTEANYAALRAQADLTWRGRRIEVRNSTRPSSPLPIKAKDAAADAVVIQAHVEMADKRPTGRVFFLGWRYGTEYRPEMARRGTDYRAHKYAMADLFIEVAA